MSRFQTPRFPDLLVLIADQSEYSRRLTRDALRAAGLKRFIEAHDGPSAIKATLQGAPDLLLLDENLPHLPGLEVVRNLSRVPSFRSPCILIAGTASRFLVAEACALDVREILCRPISHSSVWRKVESVIASGRLPTYSRGGASLLPGNWS